MNKNLTLLAGIAGLSSCVSHISDKQLDTLPQTGIVTKESMWQTCDLLEQGYYFEIDTDKTHTGPEYAAIVHSGCGKKNIEFAQKQFSKNAVINLRKSTPIISKLIKLEKNENQNHIIFQKNCMERE